jgi:hypothetical protein
MTIEIETLRIEINHSMMDGRRIQLAPESSPDGYTWHLADGSEHDDNQPHWHAADEGLEIARQLWGMDCWGLAIVESDARD